MSFMWKMRSGGTTTGYVLLTLLTICFVPISIWVAAGSSLYQSSKKKLAEKRSAIDLICSVDTDCPPGHLCINGVCVPE